MLTEKANRAMHCERQNDFGSKVVRGSNMAHGLPPTSAQGQLLQRPPTRQPASAGEGNQGSETTTLRKAMDAVSFPILLARLPNSISPPSPTFNLVLWKQSSGFGHRACGRATSGVLVRGTPNTTESLHPGR